MWLLADKAGIHYLVSKVITTVLVFIWNFIAKKTILFSKADEK
jgi:putative flippase GtrA